MEIPGHPPSPPASAPLLTYITRCLVASITVEAVRQLGLTAGSNVTAVIKASDVILATSD
jgi:hypothetical protein